MNALKPESLKDWLPILFERSNAALSIWNFEAVVLIGILGFLATAPAGVKTNNIRILLAASFIIFAIFNGGAVYQVTLQQEALKELVNPLLKGPLAAIGTLPITATVLENLGAHLALDVGLIIAIWKL